MPKSHRHEVGYSNLVIYICMKWPHSAMLTEFVASIATKLFNNLQTQKHHYNSMG